MITHFQEISSHPLECVSKSLINDFAAHACVGCGFSHNFLGVCSAYNLLINRQNGLVITVAVCRYYFVPCAPTADVPRSKLHPHIDYRQKRGMMSGLMPVISGIKF